MAILGVDRFGAASSLAPLDRTRGQEPPLSPDLAETTAATNRVVVQALAPPVAETQQLQNLVASARAASVALKARTVEPGAVEDAAALAKADAADSEATTSETSEIDDEAPFETLDTSATLSAQDVARSFEAVAALVPTEQTLAPPLFEEEASLPPVGGVSSSGALDSGGDRRASAPEEPGARLSRYA